MMLTAPDCFSASGALSLSSRYKSPRLFGRFNLNIEKTTTTRTFRCYKASLITNPESFEVGRLVGSYGFMNVTRVRAPPCIRHWCRGLLMMYIFVNPELYCSYSGPQFGLDVEYSSEDMGRLRVQDVGEGSVKIRLYEGRITQGPLRGTPVIFKVYPGQQVGGVEADMMAANELNAHAFLQWLAFRNGGKYSAADYAKVTSERMSKDSALGEKKLWNPFEQEETIKRRRYFVIKLLHGALCGLAYMHDRERLHQSLGPSSVVLNTVVEKDAAYLVPRLRDLAFSVDIRYPKLEEGSGTLSEGLWRRASAAGAFTPMEKRAFGIADDIYEAGLLFAYLAFIPFCEVGIMDSLSLQRLLESTFKLDLEAIREYCLADDRLLEAVNFLDLGNGAGWELLQAMLNPDFRNRPIAEAVLNHRFMTGSVLF
ncbi:uncharacterized protein LOC131319957 isoform X2 [Rhododendron vialii]|uniref:uncharacterized protein LOC131319957 isoform X2 n=1 Tax=Rhododendron vialii TaxID=182163 RepID=UPI00265D961E|nr:uncharacterized protein LOC131319957 isoform X2 [Rhododendron vialii]